MSDRLAVMRDGVVEQLGPPEAVYAAPGDGVRRGVPRVGQRADRRRAGRRAGRQGAQLPARRACRCARWGRRGAVRARSSCGPSASSLQPVEDDGAGARRAQLVPRAGRPGGLPRPRDARRGAARRRADAAGGGAEHRRADVLAVRRRPRGTGDLRRRRRPGCSSATTRSAARPRRCPTSGRQRRRDRPEPVFAAVRRGRHGTSRSRAAKAIAMRERLLGVDDGVLEGDLDGQPVEQRGEGDAEQRPRPPTARSRRRPARRARPARWCRASAGRARCGPWRSRGAGRPAPRGRTTAPRHPGSRPRPAGRRSSAPASRAARAPCAVARARPPPRRRTTSRRTAAPR